MEQGEKPKPSTTFKQSLKKSGLNTSKIIGSAATAILMSIITPRIAGLSGSVLIVGLVSAVSIVVGSFTTATTETVMTTTKKVAPHLIAETVEEKETTEGGDSESEEEKPPSNFKLKEFFSKYAYLMMFVMVSLLTIGSVAVISAVTGNQNLYSGSVHVRELTESQKTELVDEITSNVIRQIETPSNVIEKVKPQDNLSMKPEQESDSEEALQGLENQMEEEHLTFEEQLQALQEEISVLKNPITKQETNPNEDLKKEIENLVQRIEKLEVQETVSPNQEPTPDF